MSKVNVEGKHRSKVSHIIRRFYNYLTSPRPISRQPGKWQMTIGIVMLATDLRVGGFEQSARLVWHPITDLRSQ
jgi:hypothetical protein